MATSIGTARLDSFAPHLGKIVVTGQEVLVAAVAAGTLGVLVAQWLQHHLRLQSAAVRGTVSCNGRPVAGARVTLVGEYGPGSGAIYSATSSTDGTWSADVAPGLFQASVQAAGQPEQFPSLVQVAPGDVAQVNLAIAC